MAQLLKLRRGEHQLFLDDELIERKRLVTRTFHDADKHPANPVLVPDRPWEFRQRGGRNTIVYGDVIREPGGPFRMWYFVGNDPLEKCCGLALSEDGVRWHKPELDVQDFEGQRTNIVMTDRLIPHFDECAGVIRDDTDPDPSRRYKSVCSCIHRPDHKTRWMVSLVSPDGVHWRVNGHMPSKKPVSADISHLTYDPVDRRYVLWVRSLYPRPSLTRRFGSGYVPRTVHLTVSKDFNRWSKPRLVFEADLKDPPPTDVYSLAALRVGPHWVGLAQMYYRQPKGDVARTLDIQLAHSRDGLKWARLNDRKPILACGGPGEWDRFNQSLCSTPVQVGDELWIYYGGRTQRHSPYKGPDNGPPWSATGIATLRIDGFCSYDASFRTGEIRTKPLHLPSADLWLNAAARWGEVRVQAVDAKGNVLADSQPLERDAVRQKVAWLNTPRVDRKVRLRFLLSNARLYSFWCE